MYIFAWLGLFEIVLNICRQTLNRHGSRLKYFRKKSKTWLKFFLAPARNHSVESLMRAVGDQTKHFILNHTIHYYWHFYLLIKGYLKIRRSWSSTSPPGKRGRPPLAISVVKKKWLTGNIVNAIVFFQFTLVFFLLFLFQSFAYYWQVSPAMVRLAGRFLININS